MISGKEANINLSEIFHANIYLSDILYGAMTFNVMPFFVHTFRENIYPETAVGQLLRQRAKFSK